ncbi:MAG: hypothetical protein ILA26_05875 [Methanobrevibacter sp.]|uniref:hypothetical protein n=1 Tax=Methanobrevibacter sp. TaxID=66852 RepID=UPI001B79D967|nr:hypothetical protein [Methanobrevibacter sp.]MBP3791538.1 hypothetical protein [Methanobrevibacter sp.]
MDLVEEYVRQGLGENGGKNMGDITIADEIWDKLNVRCKKINCNPEKLVNSIIYDYLRKVEKIPSSIDGDKLWEMLEHDNPKGDDSLKNLRRLGEIGWD